MHISQLAVGAVVDVLLSGNAIAGALEDCAAALRPERLRGGAPQPWEEAGELMVPTSCLVLRGGQAEQDLAWEWVQMKEAEQAAAASPQKPAEILTLKPGWGE
jgi:hypothetical protein